MMRALVWLSCAYLLGCMERALPEPGPLMAAPMADPAKALCVDVGEQHVCWSADGVVVRGPRALPDVAAPFGGYRCGGQGPSRVCEARTQNSPVFVCEHGACLEQRPRMPDLGEWECVELEGVVLCHERGAAAGIARGPLELGWICGRVGAEPARERVCVDLDADRPSDTMRFSCRFEHAFGLLRRRCVAASGPQLADACTSDAACPAAMSCEQGLCLPARPDPHCWLDRDCAGSERCQRGTCARVGAGRGGAGG